MIDFDDYAHDYSPDMPDEHPTQIIADHPVAPPNDLSTDSKFEELNSQEGIDYYDSIEKSLHGISETEPESNQLLGDIYSGSTNIFEDNLFDPYIPSIEIFGDPLQNIQLWDMQDERNSCAVAATNSVFRSLGLDPGEKLLSEIFENYNIYAPCSGTDPSLIDDVLNDLAERHGFGFRAQEITNFTEYQLAEILQNGNCPLIAIDAHNLYPEYCPPGSGHAVQLISIIKENGQSYAMINDPGMIDGAGKMFPLEIFFEAAEPFSNKAIFITRI